MKCDHAIGSFSDYDGGGVIYYSQCREPDDRFKFCPYCGKNVSKLKIKKPKKEIQVGPLSTLERLMEEESSRIGVEMLKYNKQLGSFLNSLKAGVKFTREVKISGEPTQSPPT